MTEAKRDKEAERVTERFWVSGRGESLKNAFSPRIKTIRRGLVNRPNISL